MYIFIPPLETLQQISHHLGINYYVNLGRSLRQQWISAKMKVWYQWQLKKSKLWGPFWNYQLKSTANSTHFSHFLCKDAELAVLFSQQLQNGPQNLDFFFSIVMAADYLFEMKNIRMWVPAFFIRNNSSVATVILPYLSMFLQKSSTHILESPWGTEVRFEVKVVEDMKSLLNVSKLTNIF